MTPTDPTDQAASEAPAPTAEDLPGLYEAALATGQAGELVRALCAVWGVNLRGLAELSGITAASLSTWNHGGRAMPRTLRADIAPLVKPTRAMQRRIADVRSRHPSGQRGRPSKRQPT